MTIVETGAAGMTLVFLCIVAALIAALITLFYAMEQSPRLGQLRQAVVRRIDRRFGTDDRDGRR